MPWKETQMIDERMNFALKSLQEGVNFSELCAAMANPSSFQTHRPPVRPNKKKRPESANFLTFSSPNPLDDNSVVEKISFANVSNAWI
ncbi:MAG: hypothetical protein JJT96_11625 [Opitutales bacterium]|nr:hypothetical protein [Opitutales bacterium]